MAESPKTGAKQKRFFRMGEVCSQTNLEAHVIRFWETEFPQLNPKKTRSGHRTYTREDIDLIHKIKRLVHDEGFTIAGAKKRLQEPETQAGQEETETLKQRLKEEIGETKNILENVLKLLDRP